MNLRTLARWLGRPTVPPDPPSGSTSYELWEEPISHGRRVEDCGHADYSAWLAFLESQGVVCLPNWSSRGGNISIPLYDANKIRSNLLVINFSERGLYEIRLHQGVEFKISQSEKRAERARADRDRAERRVEDLGDILTRVVQAAGGEVRIPRSDIGNSEVVFSEGEGDELVLTIGWMDPREKQERDRVQRQRDQ